MRLWATAFADYACLVLQFFVRCANTTHVKCTKLLSAAKFMVTCPLVNSENFIRARNTVHATILNAHHCNTADLIFFTHFIC